MQLSELLRKRRIEKGLSQSKLSKALGYEKPHIISNYENYRLMPSPKNLKKLSELLCFEPGELENVFLKEKVEKLKAQLGIL